MSRPPNIVLICVDSLRHDCVPGGEDGGFLTRWGLQGRLDTPFLARLMADAAHFTQAVATAPYTTNSLASIFTGCYPPRHGVRSFYKSRIDTSLVTLAERLRNVGYTTAAMCDIAGEALAGVGVLRGFDNLFDDEDDLFAWLPGRVKSPLLLFLHTMDVHEPYLCSAKSLPGINDEYEARLSRLEADHGIAIERGKLRVSSLNQAISRLFPDRCERMRLMLEWYLDGINHFDRIRLPHLIDGLREHGLWEEAAVFLFSDHGEDDNVAGQEGEPFCHSVHLKDGMIRVPLIVWGVGGVGPGRHPRQVSLIDICATVLELVGLEPDDHGVRGRSLRRPPTGRQMHYAEVWHCRGVRKERQRAFREVMERCGQRRAQVTACFSRSVLYQRCVRAGPDKLLVQHGRSKHPEFPAPGSAGSPDVCFASPPGGSDEDEVIPAIGGVWGLDLASDPQELRPVSLETEDLSRGPYGRLWSYLKQVESDTGATVPVSFAEAEEAIVSARLAELGYIE